LKVTARTKEGWTKDLATLAREKEGRKVVAKVWKVGGEEAVVEECGDINDVVLIGAGVGIGWATSVAREFVRLGKNVRVIAVAKTSEEVSVLGSADAEDLGGGTDMIVYLTAELEIVTQMEGVLKDRVVKYGRPDWEEVLAQVVLGAKDSEVFVGVCGPTGLVTGVGKSMAKWVGSSNVRVWNEGYSD
jgi:ferredoxin-NADP reductase